MTTSPPHERNAQARIEAAVSAISAALVDIAVEPESAVGSMLDRTIELIEVGVSIRLEIGTSDFFGFRHLAIGNVARILRDFHRFSPANDGGRAS